MKKNAMDKEKGLKMRRKRVDEKRIVKIHIFESYKEQKRRVVLLALMWQI